MVKTHAVFAGLAAVLLSGCATTDIMRSTEALKSNVTLTIGSLFNPHSTAFAALIERKKFKEADDYFAKERTYFTENKKNNLPALEQLSAGMSDIWTPKIELAIARIVASRSAPYEKWAEARNSLALGKNTYAEATQVSIFKEQQFDLKSIAALRAILSEVETEWEKNSLNAFKSYDHLGDRNFLDEYPIKLESAYFDTNFNSTREIVSTLTTEQLSKFAKTYVGQIQRSDPMTSLLATCYLTRLLEKTPRPLSLVAVIDAIKRARDAGFNPNSVPGVKIGFAEVTSKTLLKEGHIEFPAQITMDLPLEPTKMALDDLLAGPDQSSADFLIIVDVAKASASRRILTKTDADSAFVSGSKTEPNPAYEIARGRLYEARSGLTNAQNTYAPNIASAVIKAIAVGTWASNVSDAEKALYSTPPSVTSNLTSEYKYSISEVKPESVTISVGTRP